MPESAGSRILLIVGVIGIISVLAVGLTLWYLFGTNKLLYVAGTPPTSGAGGNTSTSVPSGGQQQAGSTTGSPVVNPTTGQTVGVTCPTSCYSQYVYGSGGACQQTYYKYPATDTNLVACQNDRTVTYVNCAASNTPLC